MNIHASPFARSLRTHTETSSITATRRTALPLQVRLVPALLLLIVLIADSLLRTRGDIDYAVLRVLQRLSLPGLQAIMETSRDLTALPVLAIGWLFVLLAALAVRRWLPVLALSTLPLGLGIAALLRYTAANHDPIDPTRLIRIVGEPQVGQLFNLNTTGALLLFGLLFHVAGTIPVATLRLPLRLLFAVPVVSAGLSRLWLGTHWPTDIAAAYALGALLLIILLWTYGRIDTTCGHLPFIRAAIVPHDETQPHAHALTSTIIFNGDTVSKVYAPGFVPRALYWLAFQAEFPYLRNQDALRAALLRRNLAGLLTEYWYGENRVARAIGVDIIAGRYAITSAFIAGTEPADKHSARQFLLDLADRFDEAGLPTWQIDPRQPRAMDNILETPDGAFHIIDLESGLVSPLASPRAWLRAIKRGLIPLYDDVYFDLTRAYVHAHETDMRQRLGDDWYGHLLAHLDATEQATQRWRDSEPRVWGRLLGLRRQHTPARAEEANRAYRWLDGAIDAWQTDGRLTAGETAALRTQIQEPRFLAVLPHFGVHLAIGVVLRFPFGSIVRVSYVLLNLLVGLVLFLTRRIDRQTWRQRRDIHSPLVLLMSGMPGIGTFAYLVSKPVRSNHLLLRVCIDSVLLKLPFHTYERSGLRWLIARPRYLTRDSARSTHSDTVLSLFGGPQSIVQWLAFVTAVLLIADAFVTIIDYLLAPETPGWLDAYRLLDTAGEASLASWYVTFSIFLVAALLGLIAFLKRQARDAFARHWLFLAVLALAVSIDKHVVIHDPANGAFDLHNRLEMLWWPGDAWLGAATLSVVVVGLLYRHFLLALPLLTRTLFVAGAGLFVAGEVGFRFIASLVTDEFGAGSLAHRAATTSQGALSMAGILVVIAGLLLYLQAQLGEVRLILSERYIAEQNGAAGLGPDTGPLRERSTADAAPLTAGAANGRTPQ